MLDCLYNPKCCKANSFATAKSHGQRKKAVFSSTPRSCPWFVHMLRVQLITACLGHRCQKLPKQNGMSFFAKTLPQSQKVDKVILFPPRPQPQPGVRCPFHKAPGAGCHRRALAAGESFGVQQPRGVQLAPGEVFGESLAKRNGQQLQGGLRLGVRSFDVASGVHRRVVERGPAVGAEDRQTFKTQSAWRSFTKVKIRRVYNRGPEPRCVWFQEGSPV